MKKVTKILIAVTIAITIISCGGFSKENCTETVKETFPNSEVYVKDCVGSNMHFIVIDSNNVLYWVVTGNSSNTNITSVRKLCKVQ